MHVSSRYRGAALILGFVLAGCSSDKPAGDTPRAKVYKVKGKITMAGNPVADAAVTFSPKGEQPAATGRTGADGTYTLRTYDEGDGAAAGDYVVLVTKVAAGGAASPKPAAAHDAKPDYSKPLPTPGSSGHAAAPAAESSGLPAMYSRPDQTDLKATVKTDGSNDFTFDLKP